MSARVLVVDDNAKIVEVLSAYLGAEGFEVSTACDARGALDAFDERVPDIALLDIMLPGASGIDLARRFQREHDLPIIFITARTDEIDRLIGLEVGADDYISKPFSPREVVARVKAVLRRTAKSADDDSAVRRIGDLVIDTEARTVTTAEGEAVLTRTEFDMLAVMTAHPGRVYTRLQLLSATSGDAFDGYERTVDAHIKNLRRKLGDDSHDPRYVQTVIGVGYKSVER